MLLNKYCLNRRQTHIEIKKMQSTFHCRIHIPDLQWSQASKLTKTKFQEKQGYTHDDKANEIWNKKGS